ncbi:MAG: hypothetical protein ABI553_10535 [Chloroflexota bacterium]
MAIGSAEQPTVGPSGRQPGALLKASAVATAAYALLLGLLVVIIYLEDQSITVPLVVLSAVGFIVAAVMTATHRHWTASLALAYSLIALAGDGPHQIPEIVNPTSASHTIFAVLLIVGGLVAIAFALRAAISR